MTFIYKRIVANNFDKKNMKIVCVCESFFCIRKRMLSKKKPNKECESQDLRIIVLRENAICNRYISPAMRLN